MKNKKVNVQIIITIVLIGIIISLILINLNNKNTNIAKQEKTTEQLTETTSSNAYVDMATHLSEVSAKQQELDNLQNTAGKATATASQILKNYTAYKDGQLITGTMANNGAVSKTLNAGGSYTIPAGYHNGSGKVTVNSLASQTSANATAADIASGKTAWVNGSKVTGTASTGNKLTKVLIGTLSCHFYDANPSFTKDMKTVTSNWATLTNDNFTTVFTAVGDETWSGENDAPALNAYNPATISYNASTGVVTCSLQTVNFNDNESSNAIKMTVEFYALYVQ